MTDEERRTEAMAVVMSLMRCEEAEPRDRLAAAKVVLEQTKAPAAGAGFDFEAAEREAEQRARGGA